MQRLFSMFPTGTAGAALIILRGLTAATFVVDGTAHWSLVTSSPMSLLFLVPAAFICLGLFTPYFSTLCVVMQLVVIFVVGSKDEFHLATSIMMSGTLALLGPGAYSLDGRIFGRRRLTLRSSRKNTWGVRHAPPKD